jgi:hypothetical protein
MSLIAAKKKLLMAQKGGADISELFNTSLWTGNGAARTITTGIDSGEGALVWIKGRSLGTQHVLVDSIRGTGQVLRSDSSDGSSSFPTSVTAFSASGYSLGNYGDVNFSSGTYAGWQFRRAEKFFDIVQYTGNDVFGRQIAHNLGVKPGIIIIKRINGTVDWQTYHQSRGATEYGVLNSTASFVVSSSRWENTEPTASEFTVGGNAAVNANTGTYIAYLFAHDPSSEGVIQCGSYVGNGSATGPVVNLGWRPQYLMIKNATATGDWQMIDASRGFTSANDAILLANTSGTETSANLANPDPTGFQLASTASNVNTNGQTYIYMAIREAA